MPVVATDIRGCRQVVDHGVTGLLVPPGDHAALARAIGRLAGDHAASSRMSIAARRASGPRVRPAAMHRHDVAAYERLLRRRGLDAPVAARDELPADRIRRGTPSDVAAVAALHAESISIGFLVVLGDRFLAGSTGASPAADRRSCSCTSTREQESTGSSPSPRTPAGCTASSCCATACTPACARRRRYCAIRGRSSRRSATASRSHANARGGDPGDRGRRQLSRRGIGRALVATAMDELRRRGVEHAHVVTAASNEAAQRAYFACGFQRHSTVEVHRGVAQEVLVWP